MSPSIRADLFRQLAHRKTQFEGAIASLPGVDLDRLILIAVFISLPFLLAITSAAENGATNSSAQVTFAKDVAPIVFAHCAVCHRPGQSAPFNLLTFEDVHKHTKQILEVVEKRYMPPWLPEPGHEEFAGNRRLTDEQIETIRRWVTGGAVEGDAANLPPLPRWTEGWQLGTPDLVVKLPQPYSLRPEGKDVYRNFVIPIPVSQQKYVKAVELLPGNWKVVHHAFINVDPTRYSRRKAEKENPAGFDGMALPDTAGMPGGQTLTWQPGKMASFSAPGLSWALAPDTDLVLQLHLHPSGKQELVQPSVGLYFTDQAPTNLPFRLNLAPLTLDIPAGAKDYTIEDKYVLPVDVELLGILPHAHYLAKRMEGYAQLPDETKRELLLIKDWDFNWQGDYRYAKAVALPKGTILGMRFSYDNSPENVRNPNQPPKRVRYGLETTDEMAELWFQLLAHTPEERKTLGVDFARHLADLTIAYNEFVLKENPNDFEAHTRVGRAQLLLRKYPEAVGHLQAAVKANPAYDRAWYELGFFYLGLERLSEAQQAFENVVRLNPDDYQAEGSLGTIFLKRGDLNRAESHFRAALKINPQDRVARQNLEIVLGAKAGRYK